MDNDNNENNNNSEDKAVKSIRAIQLYLFFDTDSDFRVNLDGLTSFIRSRLWKYGTGSELSFHAVDIPFEDGNYEQLIRLEVDRWDTKDSDSALQVEDAVEQIFLPAYMWIFAEIGIGNSHGLSYYFNMKPFEEWLDPQFYRLIHTWKKEDFVNCERVLPRTLTMSGNYSNSWAQWRFILPDHPGASWGTKEFESRLIKELEGGE